jgi:peptidoglycan/xylan/chitin deacetylase (PgdA/CDA1 family)
MIEWPGGRRLAVVINVMVEQWAAGSAPGLGPMGNPLPAGVVDHQALSWGRYGSRTGARKLLTVLARRSVPATFYVSGVLAEEQPDLVRAIHAGGHEIAAHGWAQNIVPAALDRPAEREQIRRSLAVLTDACGTTPAGWISPRCTPSANTAGLLAEAGLSWFGDVFDDDEPYLLDTGQGTIVALPFGMEINDLPMLVRYGRPTGDLAAAFEHLLDAALAEDEPAYLDVTVHAHVAGRLAGRHQLDLILRRAAQENIWVATRHQVAEHFLTSHT